MPSIATDRYVDRAEMEEFVRPRHRGVLLTIRRDGRPQSSLVTLGLDTSGRVVVSSYPERAKSVNAKRNPAASMMIMSDEFGGEWIQLDGTAEVLDMPEALDGLVEYFRVISGEHPDWDEYREAMAHQGKCLIRLTIDQWGPISKGGFPARLVQED